MGRVINTDSPTKIRNQNMRTVAEMLRHLTTKQAIDAEAKDMAATIVYALTEIASIVQSSAESWEKRDYWIKAERFLRDWAWAKEVAANLDDVLRHEAWDLLPKLLMEIAPHVATINVNKFMRKPIIWQGNYDRLIAAEPLEQPY